MCIVRSRRVRPSRTDRFLADGRGSLVRRFAKSGVPSLSRNRVSLVYICRLRFVKRRSRCFCFVSRVPSGTNDFFLFTCSPTRRRRASVIIDSGTAKRRSFEIYCISSIDGARGRYTHTCLACFTSCVTKRSRPNRNLARRGRSVPCDALKTTGT